jgi:hypothetical protein
MIRDNGPEREGKKGAGKREVWDAHRCRSCSRSRSHWVRAGLAAAELADLCADADAVADHDAGVDLGADASGDASDIVPGDRHSVHMRRDVEPARSENRARRI